MNSAQVGREVLGGGEGKDGKRCFFFFFFFKCLFALLVDGFRSFIPFF